MIEHFAGAKIGNFSGKSSFSRRSACGMGENTVYLRIEFVYCFHQFFLKLIQCDVFLRSAFCNVAHIAFDGGFPIGTLLWREVVLHLSGSGFFQCVNKRSHRFFFLFDCKVTNYSQNCKYVADKTTAEMAIVFGLLEVMVMLF